jgi:hypothetical protein
MKRLRLTFGIMLLLISVFLLTACQQTTTTTTSTTTSTSTQTTTTTAVSFSVSLNSTTKTIQQGESFILVVTLNGINTYDSIGWASENDILQITPNGLNAVISAGATTGLDTITVTVSKGGVNQSVTCVVTVNPVTLNLEVESVNVTLTQGQTVDLAVVIDPNRTGVNVTWTQSGTLLTIQANGRNAVVSAGAATGTTTVTITATLYNQTFTKAIQVTVNEVSPFVEIGNSSVDVKVGQDVELELNFLPAYLQGKTWNIEFSNSGYVLAEVTVNDFLKITGAQVGQVLLTLTMTSNGVEYQDTIEINVRPLGFISVGNYVYDPFDLQLHFTESTLFSSIDESIWQEYDIILGAASNQGTGDLNGQFVFAMTHLFAKDGDKDVIQVMANGMSAIAVKIPSHITDLGAIEFSMKMAKLEATLDRSWRMDFLIATVVDGKTVLYGRALSTNSGLSLGSLTIQPADLLRDGYQTYRFYVNQIPQNAGNYIVIYFGNTTSFNGTEENRTYIESFNFLNKELVSISKAAEPTKLQYVVGQPFDPTGLIINAFYSAGNTIAINHSQLTFDYDFSTPGTKTVSVQFGNQQVSLQVEVIERAITSLSVTNQPTKVVYTAGDVFDPTGLVVTAHFNDGTTEVVSQYTYDLNPLTVGTTSLVLSYESKTVSIPITVTAVALIGITVTSVPTKTEYVVGQTANYQGIVITANYNDASSAVIPFSSLSFTGFNSSVVVSNQVITVSYGGQTATFTINIIAQALVGIEIQKYPKITYLLSEESDWSALIVRGVNNDGTKIVLNNANLTIGGFDSLTLGQKTITITYQSFSISFVVTITEDTGNIGVLTSETDFEPGEMVANVTMFTSWFSGENAANIADFDVLLGRVLNDAQRNLQYSTSIYMSGEGEERVIIVQTNGMSAMAVRIPDGITAADITAFSFSMSGEGLVLGNTITFRPSFRFSSIFDGVEYFHAMSTGSYFLPQSGDLTITHADFTRTGYHDYTVMINQPALTDGKTIGNYLLIYMGNNGSFRDSTNTSLKFNGFKFWTRDVVSGISVSNQPTKTTYVVGEVFNPADMVIAPLLGISLYAPFTQISASSLTYSYDFSTPGQKTVLVSYGEHSVEIPVTVIEKAMTSIVITTPPNKVTYMEGDIFNPEGMVITANFNDGTSEVITNYTFSPLPLVGGAQSITMSYNDFTVDVLITVNVKIITSVEMTTAPDKLIYIEGESFNPEGMVITAHYNDETSEVITGYTFDLNPLTVATESIIITYMDFNLVVPITVNAAEIASIYITSQPVKTSYAIGESADYQGLVVTANYNNNTTAVIAFNDLEITGFDSTLEGTIIITISYLTFLTTFSITVADEVVDLGFVEVLVSTADFNNTNLVNSSTMYTSIFSGETPANRADFDVLLGRVLNDAERNLQYSTAIYMSGEGEQRVIIVQTNGMSAMAVRIPDGLSAEDITAFSFSMSGEGLVLGNTITFKPSFRFSSISEGVEYFHATNTGTYSLAQSGDLTITHADFTRTGYHEYTVMLNQPTLTGGNTLGNYLLFYMGNNGSFRDSTNTSLKFNGFKFWTKDVISAITLTSQPTKTTYVLGETFDSTGLVVTPTYEVDVYGAALSLPHASLQFIYDFSTVGTKIVTIHYHDFTLQVEVEVIEAPQPE